MGSTSYDFTVTNIADEPAQFIDVSGDFQNADLLDRFAQPLQLTLVDQYLNPIEGATVNFASFSDTSSASVPFDDDSAVTDPTGTVQTGITAGSESGDLEVSASAGGGDLPLPAARQLVSEQLDVHEWIGSVRVADDD